jgi:signal peptidase I
MIIKSEVNNLNVTLENPLEIPVVGDNVTFSDGGYSKTFPVIKRNFIYPLSNGNCDTVIEIFI